MKKILIAVALLGLSFSNISYADTLEGALTELSAITSTMSPAEITEKINRFIERAPAGTDITKILTDKNLASYIPTTGNGNGNGNGNSGNNGGSTCTGNPHNCNSGSGITEEQLKASQDEQDKKQLAKDQSQDTAIDSKADQTALNDVSVKTDHAFNIAVEGRATANNALSTVYGLIPQVLDNGKKITDVDNKVDANKAEQAVVDKNQNDHIIAVQDAAQTANEKADAGAVRADNIEKSLANTDERSINNAVRLDGVEAKNDEQDNAIAGKADQSALDKEVVDRTKGDNDLADTIKKNKDDQAVIDNGQNVRMDGIETQAGILDTRVGKTEVRLDNAEGAIRETNEQLSVTDKRSQNNAVRLDGVETKNTEQDKLISQKVDTTTFKDDQERQDAVIATKASKKELANETTSRKSADAKLSSRIDSNDATLVQHDERITSNTNRIGSVEKRVSNFENQTNRRFSDIDKRIGDNRKVASAGIAGAGAMANIPQVTQNGNVSVGAGIGGYDGEQAVAVGFSARVSESVTTKVSVSTNTQSEVLWGAGVGVEW